MVHAPQVRFLKASGVNDSVVFLGVESDADGGLVMRLSSGAVELVLVLIAGFIMAELFERAVIDPDVCVGRGADDAETDVVIEYLYDTSLVEETVWDASNNDVEVMTVIVKVVVAFLERAVVISDARCADIDEIVDGLVVVTEHFAVVEFSERRVVKLDVGFADAGADMEEVVVVFECLDILE